MKSSSMQRKLYEMYLNFRKQPPTRMSLIKKYWRVFAVLLLPGALVAIVYYFLIMPAISFLIIGMVVGASLNILGYLARLARTWPYIEAIVDWKKLEVILAHDKNNGSEQ